MSTMAEQYLESLMPSREEVAAFVEEPRGQGWLSRHGGVTYDSELGWIHAPSVRQDGVGRSRTFFHYEPDRARKLIQHAEGQCRIHTFGNSFTHCDQVSDGETWQEYLAAHLREPIRNYGVGGYSVYQAYLRMKQVFPFRGVDATRCAPHIILNIYDHDHHRNLFRWWAVNFGQRVECGFTCPHLKINVENDSVEEVPNLLRTPEDVYKLCDRDWVIATFRDDPILRIALLRRQDAAATWKDVELVAAGFGLSGKLGEAASPVEAIHMLFEQAALYSTQRVVKLVEAFAHGNGKKLLVVLSHSSNRTANVLSGKPRWDQSFVDFIQGRGYPVIDMRDPFAAEFATCKDEPKAYLRKYYNSHHSPAGNYFTAWAIKDAVVNWLDPKPAPYTPGSGTGGRGEVARVEHDGWKPT